MGFFVWRNNTGCVKQGSRFIKFGLKGSPDIIGFTPKGIFIGVECKKEKGGIVSEDQRLFLERLRQDGGIAIVAHSSSELKKELDKYV